MPLRPRISIGRDKLLRRARQPRIDFIIPRGDARRFRGTRLRRGIDRKAIAIANDLVAAPRRWSWENKRARKKGDEPREHYASRRCINTRRREVLMAPIGVSRQKENGRSGFCSFAGMKIKIQLFRRLCSPLRPIQMNFLP